MPWGPAPTFGLIIPSNAGPLDPQTLIGAPGDFPAGLFPADLIAKYAGGTIVSGIINRTSDHDYSYDIYVTGLGTPFRAVGGENSVSFVVVEEYRIATSAFDVKQSFTGAVDISPRGGNPPSADFTIEAISAARGMRMSVAAAPGISSGNALTTPAAESATFSAWTTGVNSMSWNIRRVYRVTINVSVSNNLAGAMTTFATCRYQVNVRSANGGSGVIVGSFQDTTVQNGHLDDDATHVFYVANNGAANLVSGLGVTITKGFSSIGSSVFIDGCNINVEDVTDTFTGATAVLAASIT